MRTIPILAGCCLLLAPANGLKTVDPERVKQKMNSIRDRIAAQAAEL